MPIDNKEEYILCAALHIRDNITYREEPVQTGFIILGYRHQDCYRIMIRMRKTLSNEEGFFTSKNKFVDREEAYVIAFGAGQIKYDSGSHSLTSDDLY